MVTRFDNYFEDLIGSKFVDSSPNRFEWCQGNLQTESGKYYMVSIPQTELSEARTERIVFQYLVDNVTHKKYIAHSPSDMGPNFFIAAVSTPLILCGTVVVHLAKLIATIGLVAYRTFNDVYPDINEKEIIPIFLRNLEKNFARQKNEIVITLEEIFNSVKYAAGLEVAAIYGAFYFRDPQTAYKMQTIYAEIEKKWNHDIDYKNTPLSYGVRFGALFSREFIPEFRRALDTEGALEKVEAMKGAMEQLKECYERVGFHYEPAFYSLQCLQERHQDRIEEIGDRYASYDQMIQAIRKTVNTYAEEERRVQQQEGQEVS